MKKIFLLLILTSSIWVNAQVTISGSIFDLDGNPLEGASVYLNNTSIGATTDTDGQFYLNLPKGQYKLVVSYLGYISERYPINTNIYEKPLIFKLIPKTNELDEVVIKRRKKISANRRKEFLKIFRQEFLGTSKFAKSCKITNENVIDFDYQDKTKILEVFALEPLKIVNESLGYKVIYDLTNFKLASDSLTYLGNVRYIKIEGSKRKQKQWKKNRDKAYRGSQVHFLKAVMKNQTREEGFLVDKIQRKPNPRIPSIEEIDKAYKIIKRAKNVKQSSYSKNPISERELMKSKAVMRRAQLKPYIERLVKRNIKPYEFTIEHDGKQHLMFEDYLKVVYLRELPDKNYRRRNSFTRYQTSLIKLNKEEVPIEKIGALSEPLDVLLLGYWGYEKVGDALPLDYNPKTL